MFSSLLSKPKHSSYAKTISLESLNHDSRNFTTLILPNSHDTISDSNTISGSNTIINEDGTVSLTRPEQPRKFHSTYQDTIPLKQRYPNLKHQFPKFNIETCPDDTVQECVDETKTLINKILQEKLGVAKTESTQYIKYNTAEIDDRGRERTIIVQNYAEDPMLPPKHKLRKNRHQEPSPPPPILKKSDAPKPSKEDQKFWNVPSLVSKWKNNQGFTIDLDKRVGSLEESSQVNIKKLTDLSSALDQADKQARKEIKERNEQRKKLSEEQEKQKEMKLKELNELNKRKYDGGYNSNKRRH